MCLNLTKKYGISLLTILLIVAILGTYLHVKYSYGPKPTEIESSKQVTYKSSKTFERNSNVSFVYSIPRQKALKKLHRKARHHIRKLARSSFNCTYSDCYPPSKDLLLGRKRFLFANSTCGYSQPDNYCVLGYVLQQHQKLNQAEAFFKYVRVDRVLPTRCFMCDSTTTSYDHRFNKLSHRIENVIMDRPVETDSRGREIVTKWWQSKNGEENVYIRFDLESIYTMSVMIMRFKTFPPAAMLLEKSDDFGRTWKTLAYYAHNCALSFPNVTRRNTRDFRKPFCTSKYSGLEYSTGGELYYAPLTQIKDHTIDRTDLQDSLKITNLRFNFTKLHVFGNDLQSKNYYYAVNEIKLYGSCLCHGHASRCSQIKGVQYDREFIGSVSHGRCECEHNTAGENCQRCLGLYNDRPWRAAQNGKANECKLCECNGHANKCYFNSTLYAETNQKSGGVCECLHNTEGFRCGKCKHGFYRDSRLPFSHPDSCKECKCDPTGTKSTSNNLCISNHCECKLHVQGETCNECKNGYWNLATSNTNGCTECECRIEGTIENLGCDKFSGKCFPCKKFVSGERCDKCLPGYYGLSSDNENGCLPCDCQEGFSYNSACDQKTGQCSCKPHVTGKRCDRIEENYFCPSLDHILYEAEYAEHLNDNVKIDERLSTASSQDWTGPGFVKVYESGSLRFRIDFTHRSGVYDVIVRYESFYHSWKNVFARITNFGFDSMLHDYVRDDGFDSCAGFRQNVIQETVTSLDQNGRSKILFPSYCFEKFSSYELEITFSFDMTKKRSVFAYTSAFITPTLAMDSIVLIPVFNEQAGGKLSALNSIRICRENYFNLPRANDPECDAQICNVLIDSFGFSQCKCDPLGSFETPCNPYGGQCHCKTNIFGKYCDRCKPNAWGFSDKGCQSCNCNSVGAKSDFCNQKTGECTCYENKSGKKCTKCLSGFYKFPKCLKCECNGFSNECDMTGSCLNCLSNTEGTNCERCKTGYFGSPLNGIACKTCSCPGNHGNNFATSCHLNEIVGNEICDCLPGYSGKHCEVCQDMYFGIPLEKGGSCKPCQCNGNTDPNNNNNCDSKTGECKNCLFQTEGFNCEKCRFGYFGNAIEHNCQPCNCYKYGTISNLENNCNPVDGSCNCLPNVIGKKCDQCAPGYWSLNSWVGCVHCTCDTSGTYYNSTDCNQQTGQCFCRPGRGGKNCDECPDGTWGSPSTGCRRCECDINGVRSLICNKENGECSCKTGFAGTRCNYCSVGTIGKPPRCIRCGECYENWAMVVSSLSSEMSEIEDRALNLYTVIGLGSIDLFKFTAQSDSVKSKIQDINHILDFNYNKINISVLFENFNSIRSKTEAKRSNLIKQINQLDEWREDRESFNKTKNFYISLKNDTNQLLRKSFNLREMNIEGAIFSIENSYKVSNQADQAIKLTKEAFYFELNRISTEIEDKINGLEGNFGNEILFGLSLNSKKDLLAINQSIIELNNAVCGSYSLDCSNKCGAVQCNKCGYYDENRHNHFKYESYSSRVDIECSEGLESSFKRFNYLNNTFNAAYSKKEAILIDLLTKSMGYKSALKHHLGQIKSLNISLINNVTPIINNQSSIENLIRYSKKLANKYKSHASRIKNDCNYVIQYPLKIDHESFDSNINGIREIEMNTNLHIDSSEIDDMRSYFDNTRIIYDDVKSLEQSLRTKIKEKVFLVNKRLNSSQLSYNDTEMKLANLIDFNDKIGEVKIKVIGTIDNARLRLKRPLDFVNEFKEVTIQNSDKNLLKQSRNSVSKSNKTISLVAEKVNDLELKLENVIDHLNVSKDLADKHKIKLMIDLKAKVLAHLRLSVEKKQQLRNLKKSNTLQRIKIDSLKSELHNLMQTAKSLQVDVNRKMIFFNNCK